MGVNLDLTLREKHRLRGFDKRELRIICGPKKDGIMVFWRKIRKEICNFYFSPYTKNDQVKEDDLERSYNMQGGEEGDADQPIPFQLNDYRELFQNLYFDIGF
jgi:hypothetical protein